MTNSREEGQTSIKCAYVIYEWSLIAAPEIEEISLKRKRTRIGGAHRKAALLQSAPVTNTTMPGGFISQTQPPAAQSTMQGPC